MASLGIRCRGNHFSVFNCRFSENPSAESARVGPSSIAISNNSDSSRCKRGRISKSTKAGLARTSDKKNAIIREKLDEWMKDSVAEIVKNLREAPLLVQVYSNKDMDGETASTTLTTEKAVAENWPIVMEKWKKRETKLPDGVIFVEQLEGEGEGERKAEGEGDGNGEEKVEEITKAWGIVVQGKGVDYGPACYLLKTSRVDSGLELLCTHFCLTRVKNFRETARSQLKNCWLSQAQG